MIRKIAIALFLLIPSICQADITDSLLAWWKLDEGSGSSAMDSSGNSRTGTLTNSPSWVSGKRGSALSFNGSNTYVESSNFADNLTNLSVSAWVNLATSTNNYLWIVNKMANFGTGDGWGVAVYSFGRVTFFTQDTGGANWNQMRTTALVLTVDGQWHHIVTTLSGGPMGTITIYFDGVAQAMTDVSSGTVASYSTSSTVKLGIDGDLNAAYAFNGLIDDARIYDRVLSASEAMSIYLAGTPQAIIKNANVKNARHN